MTRNDAFGLQRIQHVQNRCSRHIDRTLQVHANAAIPDFPRAAGEILRRERGQFRRQGQTNGVLFEKGIAGFNEFILGLGHEVALIGDAIRRILEGQSQVFDSEIQALPPHIHRGRRRQADDFGKQLFATINGAQFVPITGVEFRMELPLDREAVALGRDQNFGVRQAEVSAVDKRLLRKGAARALLQLPQVHHHIKA